MADPLGVIGAVSGGVGALTGVISLGWQVHTHRRSGRVVRVTCGNEIPVYDLPDGSRDTGDHFVAIYVHNAGGASVHVLNYGVSVGGRKSGKNLFVTDPPSWATRLPASVEPGGEPVRLLVPADELRRLHEAGGISYRQMLPWVELGDGRRVYANRPVPLA